MITRPLQLSGVTLCGGGVTGAILKLDEPLSFWGGFDPKTGQIIDQAHPQCGQSVNGVILALPGARGSAGTPAAIAEALRAVVGPLGFILPSPDVNITIGVSVANRLYHQQTPVRLVEQRIFAGLKTGQHVHF